MDCTHELTPAPAVIGAQSSCVKCDMQMIHTGSRWVWTHGLSPRERKALTTVYATNEIMGKHR